MARGLTSEDALSLGKEDGAGLVRVSHGGEGESPGMDKERLKTGPRQMPDWPATQRAGRPFAGREGATGSAQRGLNSIQNQNGGKTDSVRIC